MGDAVQAVTTTQVDQAKFVTKKQARKLDRAREDYENLMEKAAKLEAKGKIDKLNRKNAKADAVMDKYEARAKAAGAARPRFAAAQPGAGPHPARRSRPRPPDILPAAPATPP